MTSTVDTSTATPLALALPRAPAVTSALLAPVEVPLPVLDLRSVRSRLLSTLPMIMAEVKQRDRLVLDHYRLALALDRPEWCKPSDEFNYTSASCRRSIGVQAVERCVREKAPLPQIAVSEILATVVDDASGSGSRPPWWREWYIELGPGGRAAVEAEAVTWATELWTALDWGAFPRPVVIDGHEWWDCPGTAHLTLHGRAEVRTWVDERPVIFVTVGGAPSTSWQVEIGYPALVAALARGEKALPARIVGFWPTTGHVRVLTMDGNLLHQIADAVTSATTTWARVLTAN